MWLVKTGAFTSWASVGDVIADMLLACLKRGMRLPFTICYTGIKGGVCVERLQDLDHAVESLFKNAACLEPPLNVIVVDWLGRPLKATIIQDGEVLHVPAYEPEHVH